LRHVEQLLGSSFLRVDDAAATNGMDDVNSISQLINKGEETAEKHYEEVFLQFINGMEAAPWR
jgi:hypothetical protein